MTAVKEPVTGARKEGDSAFFLIMGINRAQSIIPPSSVSLMGETENEESSSLLISLGSYKTLS